MEMHNSGYLVVQETKASNVFEQKEFLLFPFRFVE